MVALDIETGLLEDTGYIEGSDGFFLFSIQSQIFDDVLGKDKVEYSFRVLAKTRPEDFLGDWILVAKLDKFAIVIKIIEDIGNKVFFFDLILQRFSDVI